MEICAKRARGKPTTLIFIRQSFLPFQWVLFGCTTAIDIIHCFGKSNFRNLIIEASKFHCRLDDNFFGRSHSSDSFKESYRDGITGGKKGLVATTRTRSSVKTIEPTESSKSERLGFPHKKQKKQPTTLSPVLIHPNGDGITTFLCLVFHLNRLRFFSRYNDSNIQSIPTLYIIYQLLSILLGVLLDWSLYIRGILRINVLSSTIVVDTRRVSGY